MGSREEKTIICIAIAIAALFLGMFVFSNVSALEDLSSSYLLTNGSRPLIGNWNAGNYNISLNELTLGIANNNYSFPVTDGLPSQILITDGNGTLTFEDIPLVGEFEYFLHNETSDIATYYNMTTSIPTHPTFTLNSNNVADGEVLTNFATSVNFPSITVLPEGISGLHIHAYRTRVGNTEARVYYNMYARDEFGAEVLLGTSMMSEQLTGISSDYNIFTSIANPTALNLTDRIVIRIFVEKTGVGTLNTFLEIEGTTVSHFAFPSQAVSAANFVPYVGATKDVDLGAHDLFVGSDQTPDRINTAYPDENSITIAAQDEFLFLVAEDDVFLGANVYYNGTDWRQLDGGTYPTLLEFGAGDPPWWLGTGTDADPTVFTELGRFSINGQFRLPITGSSAGILLGGDAHLYRGVANILYLGAGDSMRIQTTGLLEFRDGNSFINSPSAGIVHMEASSRIELAADVNLMIHNLGSTNFARRTLNIIFAGDLVHQATGSVIAHTFGRSFANQGTAWVVQTKNDADAQTTRITLQGGYDTAQLSFTNVLLSFGGDMLIGGNMINWGDGVYNIGSGIADDVDTIYYHTLSQHSDRDAKENISLWDINKESNIILPEVYSYNWKERSFTKNVTYTEEIVDKYGNITHVESWRMEEFTVPASDPIYGFIADEMEDSLISTDGTTYDPISLLAKSIAKIHELEDRIEYLEQFLLSPIK